MKERYIKASDVPLIRTNTLSGVKRWMSQLKEKDMFWHMDDDARQIRSFTPPVASNLLESQRLLALNICKQHCISIWNVIPELSTLKAFCNSRIYESGPIIEELSLHSDHDCMTQLLIYGVGTDDLCGITDAEITGLTYLEWIPPANGGTARFRDSYETDMMRYTGYWTNREWGHAFRPDNLHEAETWLFDKYRKYREYKCQR